MYAADVAPLLAELAELREVKVAAQRYADAYRDWQAAEFGSGDKVRQWKRALAQRDALLRLLPEVA